MPFTTPKLRSPVRRLLVGATVLGLLMTACGDDDSSADSSTTTTSSPSSDSGSAPEAVSVDAVCRANVEVDEIFGGLGPEATPEDTVAAAEQAAEVLDVEPPADIADVFTTLTDAVDAAADGEADALDTPEVNEATGEFGQWVYDECGFEPVDVTATEYHFDGVGADLPAGVAAFRMTNEGDEPHVLVISRKKAGVTESIDELLQQEDPSASFDDVASGAFAEPGGTGVVTADLTPGEYVMICPIPIGFTGEGPPPEDAAPHFTAGMVHTFTVG